MKLIYVIMILAVIVSGCGGGGSTAVPSVNGSVTPSSGSGGTFSITVHIPGPENMEAKVIPWQRKTLKVTVKPESGLDTITPVTVDISGSGDYTATVPNVPVGLNEATIEVLDANDRLLAMRKQGFQMDHGGDVKPAGKIIMGVSLDPTGGIHCDPNYIEIKKNEILYVENQNTGAGYSVTIGAENQSVSAATASVPPVTAATFPAQAFTTFSATAGVYNISAGGPVLGRVKVYDYNASFVPEMVLITAGTFQMGDPDGGVGDSSERPRHEVTLTRNFYMSKYEVRNKEYICYDPAHTSGGGWTDPNYPVENISWYNAVTYCNWLSAQEGRNLCYTDSNNDGNLDTMDITKDGYRLPT
ncbi:MAG: formylglycine-generating enzyme family protein, partial [Candidatus Eremiobacterota bacterium]